MTSIEDVDPLGLFFRRFLHQDWMYEFESVQSAYAELLKLPSREGLLRLMEQLASLLELDDRKLDETMRRYSVDLDVGRDLGWDEREWLQSLRERAEAELAARPEAG